MMRSAVGRRIPPWLVAPGRSARAERDPAARPSAFTMLEMVMVIVIVAILAMVIVPRLGTSLSTLPLYGEADKLRSRIREMQSRAVMGNKAYKIIFYPTNDNYTVQYWDAGSSSYVNYEVGVVIGNHIDLASTSYTSDTVVLDRFGSPDQDGGTIVLQNVSGTTRTLTVAAGTGHVSVQ